MKNWFIVIIGMGIALSAPTALSGFLGLHTYSFVITFLLAILLFWGISSFSISAGIITAVASEFFSGMVFGTLVLPFLITSMGLVFLQTKLSIRPLLKHEYGTGAVPAAIISALVLIPVFFITTAGAQYVLDRPGFLWSTLWPAVLNWPTLLYNMVILLVYVLFFVLLTKRPDYDF